MLSFPELILPTTFGEKLLMTKLKSTIIFLLVMKRLERLAIDLELLQMTKSTQFIVIQV